MTNITYLHHGDVLHAIFKEMGHTVNMIDEEANDLINNNAFAHDSLDNLSLSELNEGILRVRKANLERKILSLQSELNDKKQELKRLK